MINSNLIKLTSLSSKNKRFYYHNSLTMYKGIPYSNKIIKRREQERLQVIHKQNLRNIRPLTTNVDIPFQAVPNPLSNNKKKDMLQEDRFTEIERQNRMLLEKIHSIMNKKSTFKPQKLKRNNSINNDRQRMNKSLNQVYRKKQLGDIEIQNAKLLKRIMDKKSDYDSKKLKQEWKKQKQVIKNIANYPFIIRDRIYKGRKKSMTSNSFNHSGFTTNIQQQETTLSSPIQLVRIRNLSGNNFLITVKYDGKNLQILGDNKSTKEIKIIEIPKQEGLEFIQYECEGRIELIFECLRYDPNEKVLYLVGKEVHLENKDEEENEEEILNTEGAMADKSHEEEKILEGKGLKKRQMSNIYEIQNSEIETQPHKLTENNINSPNIDEANQLPAKSHIKISDDNANQDICQQNHLIQKTQHNDKQTLSNSQPINDLVDALKLHIQSQSIQAKEKVQALREPVIPVENEPLAPVQNQQNRKEQLKQQQQVPQQNQNQQSNLNGPQAKVEKEDSRQICGIKSQFQLTSMLQKAIG